MPSQRTTIKNPDVHFMRRAIALARRGLGMVRPNPLVGAVVVLNNQVIGQGWHGQRGPHHAEVLAIENAGKRARNATLYVTLEPCNHTGKTPPCVEAILSAGISRVVYATSDPNPQVVGGGVPVLQEQGVLVEGGCCEVLGTKLIQPWMERVTTGGSKPIVVLGRSLEGKFFPRFFDWSEKLCPASTRFLNRFVHWYEQEGASLFLNIEDLHSDTFQKNGKVGVFILPLHSPRNDPPDLPSSWELKLDFVRRVGQIAYAEYVFWNYHSSGNRYAG